MDGAVESDHWALYVVVPFTLLIPSHKVASHLQFAGSSKCGCVYCESRLSGPGYFAVVVIVIISSPISSVGTEE